MTKTRAIFDEISRHILDGTYAVGQRLAPVRTAALDFDVSKNTIVEVYDRLCAKGLVESKRGSGFFVADVHFRNFNEETIPANLNQAVDRISLLGAQLNHHYAVRVGDGRAPSSWMSGVIPKRLGPNVLAELGGDQSGYGNLLGNENLREQITLMNRIMGIDIAPNNVLTTFGANHALDLIIRRFLQEGQTVLVDDPGYYPLFAKLSLARVHVVGVPRGANGPDLEVLEKLAKTHKPSIYFTQSLCQNPTGSSLDLATAHGMLQASYKHGFAIVDNDPFVDLPNVQGVRLGQLDHFRSVIQISSFSKLLSASIRVGYIIAPKDVCEKIAKLKLVTTVNSSGLAETLVADLIVSRRYQRHIKKLAVRLTEVRASYLDRIKKLGLQSFAGDGEGYYSYLMLPDHIDEDQIVKLAASNGIFLASGRMFRANQQAQSPPTIRINVARSEDSRFYNFLRTTLKN